MTFLNTLLIAGSNRVDLLLLIVNMSPDSYDGHTLAPFRHFSKKPRDKDKLRRSFKIKTITGNIILGNSAQTPSFRTASWVFEVPTAIKTSFKIIGMANKLSSLFSMFSNIQKGPV